jgi:hypothetical protein
LIKFKYYEATDFELRKFAFVMTAVSIGIAFWLRTYTELSTWWIFLIFSLGITVASLKPGSLRAPYDLWMNFGHGLSWLNTYIILLFMFYFILSPIGLFRRFLGKSEFWSKNSESSQTYATKSKYRPPSHFDRIF